MKVISWNYENVPTEFVLLETCSLWIMQLIMLLSGGNEISSNLPIASNVGRYGSSNVVGGNFSSPPSGSFDKFPYG